MANRRDSGQVVADITPAFPTGPPHELSSSTCHGGTVRRPRPEGYANRRVGPASIYLELMAFVVPLTLPIPDKILVRGPEKIGKRIVASALAVSTK